MIFPAASEKGVITTVTDASRADMDDGLGGFAFVVDIPSVVFVMSQPWPREIKQALDAATETRRSRREERTVGCAPVRRLSMPAAETLAAIAMAMATARRSRTPVRAVIAVGDCDPAASALSMTYSPSPQLRRLMEDAVKVSPWWLGVSIPRELNTRADALSHPSNIEGVRESLRRMGWQVVDVGVPPELWGSALEAASLPLATDESRADALEIHKPDHAQTHPSRRPPRQD